MSRPTALTAVLLLAAAWAGAEEGKDEIFSDVAPATGLVFEHDNGMTGQCYFNENMGSGAALFDYDGDGDLDAYLVQGHLLAKEIPGKRPTDRLFKNELVESGELRFVDTTAASGIRATGYGMGAAAGDYDNDGDIDLYVTNNHSNQLWQNDGGGVDGRVTFTDVTRSAGADDSRWSVSASFFDYDRDGWLDLFVVNYVDFDLPIHKPCRSFTGALDYCSPLAYRLLPDRLLRNRGRGADGRVTFERVTHSAGVAGAYGAGLGVVTADFDGDGWLDVYVANDQTPNQMWLNKRDGTFAEEALLAGTALNADGRPEAGMGVTLGDVDADGDFDVLVSHLGRETNTLYRNEGEGFFSDSTAGSGLGTASWDYTGFGVAFVDYDNDGWLDVYVANGAVKNLEHLVRKGDPYPLHEPNQLYRNLGGGRFADVTSRAGAVFAHSEVSRGVAVGDVDNDGDSDLLLSNNAGPARLLLNLTGARKAWLGLRLVLKETGRDAYGAVVGVVRGGEAPVLWRRVQSDGSYASASDPRVLVGLGDDPGVEKVHVRWPGGTCESWQVEEVRRYVTLREGSGKGGC